MKSARGPGPPGIGGGGAGRGAAPVLAKGGVTPRGPYAAERGGATPHSGAPEKAAGKDKVLKKPVVRTMLGDKSKQDKQQEAQPERKSENVVVFESEPMLTLPKKAFPKLGRMKKSTFANLKMAEAKFNAEAIMSTMDPDSKPRYAKTENFQNQKRHALNGGMPSIEILENDGASLLGIPGTSCVHQFAMYMDGKQRKQIVIAMHEKAGPREGPRGGLESDATVMRSGVAVLAQQLTTLRMSLAQSRIVHNTYANEAQKIFVGPKY